MADATMTPTGGCPIARPMRMPSGKERFGAVEGAKNQPADAEPNRQGYPGRPELQRRLEERDREHHAEPDEHESDGSRRTKAHDAAARGVRCARHRSGSTNASSRSTVIGALPCFQRPLHEAEVDRADHGGSALGQFKERAVSQSDLCITVGCASLRCESEFVKQFRPGDRSTPGIPAPCASGGSSG